MKQTLFTTIFVDALEHFMKSKHAYRKGTNVDDADWLRECSC